MTLCLGEIGICESECTASPAVQAPPKMGHNQPPEPIPYHIALKAESDKKKAQEVDELYKLVGPKITPVVAAFQCNAAWVHHAEMSELRRLAVLQGRIIRAQLRLDDLRAERTKIMSRCIKRMRRLLGLN